MRILNKKLRPLRAKKNKSFSVVSDRLEEISERF